MFDQLRNSINKKNLINFLLLGILVLAIPLTVGLVRQQQILLSRAAAGEVKFLTKAEGGNDCVITRGGSKVAICEDVYVKIVAPSGSDIKTQPLSAGLPQTELISKAYAQSNVCEAGYPQQCDVLLPNVGETVPGQQFCSPGVDLGGGVCGYDDSLAGQVTCTRCEPIELPTGSACWVDGGYIDQASADNSCTQTYKHPSTCKQQVDSDTYADGCTKQSASGGPTGIPVGQGGCCNTSADCNANNKQFSDNKSTEGWTCTDTNPSCQGGKACKAPEASGLPSSCCSSPSAADCTNNRNNVPENLRSDFDKCVAGGKGGIVLPPGTPGAPADSGKKDEGQPCDSDDQCKSSNCGYRSSDSGSSVMSKVPSLVGIVYAKGAGEACTKDSECDSGNCCAGPTCNPRGVCSGGGSSGGGSSGGSSTNKSNGESCTKDSECTSGNCCAGPTCNPRNVCAPGGSSGGGSSGRANGEACTTDSQCSSGNCCAGPSCNPRNVCAPGGGGGESRQKVCLSSGTEGSGGSELPSSCCSSPSAADCTNNRNNVPENLRSDFDKCVAGGKGGIVLPPGTPGAPETPAVLTITQYRKAENPTDLNSATFVSYPAGGTVVPFSFSNTQLGDKFIFVQFKDNKGGVTTSFSDKIKYVGPDPEIKNRSCTLDIKDGSLVFRVDGDSFGGRNSSSTLMADNTTLETESWEDKKVVARMKSPPDVTKGKSYSVTLKRSDGVQATEECKVDTTQVVVGAKLFCRTQNNFDQDNVDMSVFQTQGVGLTGPQFVVTSKTSEKVTIDKSGVIQNLKTVLQEGVEYMICLKAPLSLRACTDRFIATSGTNSIKDFVLPRGDLNADDTINSVDASSLKRQWGPIGSSSTKNCDFNRDSQCNSFEWGCMLKDFNTSSEKEPQ